MAKTIVITNRKGGVGKSAAVANLGIGLAGNGKKTLIIDTDNQHSLTVSMGIAEPDKLPITLANIISDIIIGKEIDPEAGIIHHCEGVDIMPANNTLTGIELALASILVGRETILRQYIEKVKPLYDYILLDCAPTIDLLTVNSLTAADCAIIPVTPKYLDARGLELLLKSIAQIRQNLNPNLTIGGILFTMVDNRTILSKEIIRAIEEAYGEKIRIFNSRIPHSIRAAETSATGKSIFSHDPTGRVAAAYSDFTREVLSDVA